MRGLVLCFIPPRLLQSVAFFLTYSLHCVGCFSPWHRVLPRTIQSGALGRAPLRPGCSNPGRLFVVFSPLPRTLQSVAPGSRPDDAVRGLRPSSNPPRMLLSGASCFFLFLRSGVCVCGALVLFFFRAPIVAAPPLLPPLRSPWHLVPCRGSSCVVRASRVRGTWWPLWLGTCPHAVVVAGGVPLWRASWPRIGAPLLVRSGRSRCFGRISRRHGSFPHPGGCCPRLYWVAARGTWRPAENRALCACCSPLPRQGRWARSVSYPFGAPRWVCPWRVPPALVLGCVRCGGLACVDPFTDASGFPYRPSCDGGLGRCTGAVSCGRRHRPFRVGGRHARVPPVCACACPAWPGRAGRPPGRVLVRLTFPLAVLGSLSACSAPSGLGLPCLWLLLVVFFSFSPPPPSLRHRCVLLCVFSGPGCLGPWRLCPPPLPSPPPPDVVPGVSCFPVSSGLCAPPPFFSCSSFFRCFFFFAGWGGFVCLGPFGVPACASVMLSLSLLCVRWLVLRGVRCCTWLSSAVSCWVLVSCFCGAVLVWPHGSPPCRSACCVLVFRCPVLCSVALCCRVVVCCCALLLVCVVACASCLFPAAARLLCVFWGVVLCVPCPLRPLRCCAALCWCPFVVLCVSSVLFLVGLWRCFPLWCCAVVPCLLLFFSLLVALVSCCSPLVLGSGPVPGRFSFCALPVRCCAGVPASLLSVRCSLALAGLAGVLCCCPLCLCVCCWAWLSSVVSWWVLVAPGVVSRWRAVACPWVLCCAVLLRVVPPGVALLCAVLFCFAPFGAAARCVVSWCAVRRLGVVCLLAPCFVSSPRAVCVLLWRVAGWCCSPLCFVPCALWGVVLCVSCRLRPVRCCCVARSPSVPCSPVLCPVVLCCRVVPWCHRSFGDHSKSV